MNIKDPLPPMWFRYPDVGPFSIGWRMGFGEDYKMEFEQWYSQLSESQKIEYQRLFPAPKTWPMAYSTEDSDDCLNDDDTSIGTDFHSVLFWEKHGAYRYSKEWLRSLITDGASPEYVMFWKPGDADSVACFGQWQPSEFLVERIKYNCAEQYMMAEKARLFGDEEMEKAIMETTDPSTMKRLGKLVHGFDDGIWNKAKYSIVLNGNYAKFTQNRAMCEFLLGTGEAILVEASPLDVIWGIGLGAGNEKSQRPEFWRGRNLLGFALMEVRDEIARVWCNRDLIDWGNYPDWPR